MKSWVLIAAASLILGTAARADVTATEEMSYDVDPGARISLENINGDIRVSGGGDRVHVIARKKAGKQEYLDELKVIVDASANYLRIETRHPKSNGGWFSWGGDSSGSVAYELTVPSNVELDAIETVNGDVTIDAVSGKVKASTVNGGLEVNGLAGDVDLETVNGGIEARFATLGGDQRVDVEAVNGRIELYLPADASARVTAETVNGSIDADDFGLKADKGFVGRELAGELGGGEARVSLETINGSIKLKKD